MTLTHTPDTFTLTDQVWLTRLTFNPRNPKARNDLKNPREMHRTIMSGFYGIVPDGHQSPRAELNILYRIENTRHTLPTVLVQSTCSGDWNAISERLADQPKEQEISSPLENLVRLDRTFQFELFANAVVKPAGRNRVPVNDSQALPWIERQATENGFVLLSDFTGNPAVQISSARTTSHTPPIVTRRYTGMLRIVQPNRFLYAIIHGIGPAKAYGNGLITIIPT